MSFSIAVHPVAALSSKFHFYGD